MHSADPIGVHSFLSSIGTILINSYFTSFLAYFPYPSQKIQLATSLFGSATKDWWVYKRPEYYDEALEWIQYPDWTSYRLVQTQFSDPTIEQVHEKCMFKLWMSNNPTTTFFQKLEIQAKLVGLWHDEEE